MDEALSHLPLADAASHRKVFVFNWAESKRILRPTPSASYHPSGQEQAT